MIRRDYLRDFPTQFFEQSLKALLCFLLLALLGAICAGTVKGMLDLWRAFHEVLFGGDLHHAFKLILVDALTVLAMLEVFRTAMAYYAEGRVKVTYIIDTVLVSVLTEILAFWYKDMDTERLYMVIALVATLMAVRVVAIHFSPNRRECSEGL